MRSDELFLDTCRLVGDPEADALVEEVFFTGRQNQLFSILKLSGSLLDDAPDSALKTFLTSSRDLPPWFDSQRVAGGQQFFEKYALDIMALLGGMALPYCYAASPGNKALYLSDKMRHSPGKRLFDTAEFVIGVLSPGSFAGRCPGNLQINKVRLIHALSRYHLKRHSEWRNSWGEPINQEDMAGTNLAFSYIILMGLQQSGHSLSSKEREDFVFVWRYIGYQLHIEEQLLPESLADAARLTHTIKRRNIKMTEEGVVLTQELLTYYKSIIPAWQARLVESQMRLYLGNEVAACIGLSADPLRDRLASFFTSLQSLKNLFTISQPGYAEMMARHRMTQYASKKSGTSSATHGRPRL